MIIYCARNKINGRRYVGMTKYSLDKRWNSHCKAANRGSDKLLCRAIRKYGALTFVVKIIDSANTWEILCEKEKYWIKHYVCKAPLGYNLTDGGDGLVGPSATVRRKMRKGQLGRLHSEETKRLMSLAHRGKKMPPVSEETRRKRSLAALGKKQSSETITKRVAKLRGQKRTKKFCTRLSKIAIEKNFGERLEKSGNKTRWVKGQSAWNKGKTMSVKWRKNLSEAHKGYVMPELQRKKIGRKGHPNYAPSIPHDPITGRFLALTNRIQ